MSGTGCDFQRSLGVSSKWETAVAKLKDAPIRQIDVGKVSYTAPDKTTQIRYFDNIASFGLVERQITTLIIQVWVNILAELYFIYGLL